MDDKTVITTYDSTKISDTNAALQTTKSSDKNKGSETADLLRSTDFDLVNSPRFPPRIQPTSPQDTSLESLVNKSLIASPSLGKTNVSNDNREIFEDSPLLQNANCSLTERIDSTLCSEGEMAVESSNTGTPSVGDNDSTPPISDSETDNEINRLFQLRKKYHNNPLIGFLNINSLRYKIVDLREVTERCLPDVLVIEETKLSKDFKTELFIMNLFVCQLILHRLFTSSLLTIYNIQSKLIQIDR